MPSSYPALLEAGLGDEAFVRDALALLEADFREIALFALADWAKLEIVAPEMFPAVASLQRPSWGMWNGLLTALKKARTGVLRSASAEVREQVASAELLKDLLEQLNQNHGAEVAKAVRPLGQLTRTSIPKKPKLVWLLTLPINLRNRIAHDVPSAGEWWAEAAEAMRPLIEFHAETHPVHGMREQGLEHPAPWFLEDDESGLCAFNGLSRDMAVNYVTRTGESKYSPERSQAMLEEFQRLLGKTETQETDFKKLLTKLAPEEIKGVMMGDYLVGKPVGAGGFATVHAARQLSTGRKVAVKILHDGMGEEIQQRFQQEASFLSRLDHPKIVAVFGYGEEPWSAPRAFSLSDEEWFQTFSKGAPVKSYIAMEWIDGRTLDDVFVDEKPDTRILADWFSQSAAALAGVHATGMIHRDIKPANLMVTEEGDVKLMDFGIARSTSDQRTMMTEAGKTFGTPAYMSPEQIRAADLEAEVGTATDVYSLCATFYELFTGNRLYGHDTENMEMIKTRKLTGQRPERPRLVTKSLPWELETIVMGGLESDIGDRYPSMDDLKRDIDHYLHDEPIEYTRPSLWRRMRLGYRRNRTVANLVGVFLLLAIAGVVFYIVQITESRAQTAHELAVATLDKGARDCDDGRRGVGLHALLRAYQIVDSDDPLSFGVRDLIGAWSHSIRPPLVHDDNVVAVALSDDASRALCLTTSHRARLWDTVGNESIGRPLTQTSGVRLVALSGDGSRAMTAGDNEAQLWEAATARPIGPPLRHLQAIRAIAVSRNGQIAMTASEDQTARVWNAQNGELLATLDHASQVVAVALDDEGRRAITGSRKGYARLWDLETRSSLDLMLASEGYERANRSVDGVAISGDGLVAVCRNFFGVGRLDAATGEAKMLDWSPLQEPEPIDLGPPRPNTVAISRDGEVCLFREGDLSQLYDAKSQTPIGGNLAGDLAVFGNGSVVLTGSEDGFASFWDARTGKPLGTPIRFSHPVRTATISDGGTAAIAEGHLVRLRSTGQGDAGTLGDEVRRVKLEDPEGFPAPGVVMALSSDGTTAIGGHDILDLRTGGHWPKALIWDLETGKTRGRLSPDAKKTSYGLDGPNIVSVEISGDGAIAILASEGNTARIWNTGSGKPTGDVIAHEGHVNAVAISRDGSVALTASDDGTAKAWSGTTGRQIGKAWPHDGEVVTAAVSADGSRAITGSNDNAARIWDARTGDLLFRLPHLGAVIRVAISGNGRRAVTRSGPVVQVWDVQTGRPVGHPHLQPVRHSEFDPEEDPARRRALGGAVTLSFDGKRMFTARETSYRLWDVETGYPLGLEFPSTYWVADLLITTDRAVEINLGREVVSRALPRRALDDPERLRLSVEVRTGLQRVSGVLQRLSHDEWLERRSELETLGGPCDIVR